MEHTAVVQNLPFHHFFTGRFYNMQAPFMYLFIQLLIYLFYFICLNRARSTNETQIY